MRNEITDTLSRTPCYFDQPKPEGLEPESVRSLTEVDEEDTEYCKVLDDFSLYLINSNPKILKLEKTAQNDSNYIKMLEAIKSGRPPGELPADNEGRKMRGEWKGLSVMPG